MGGVFGNIPRYVTQHNVPYNNNNKSKITHANTNPVWPGEMVVRMRDVLATPGWC